MIGQALAVLAGFCLAASFVFLSRGVHRSGEVSSSIPIFSFVGLVFFGLPILVSGEYSQLTSLSLLGAAALFGAGVFHFVLGRITGFTSIRLIGANRAVPIHSCSLPIGVMLGIVLLGEPFTPGLGIAVVLIFGGIILISTRGNSAKKKEALPQASLVTGVLTALGAAVCWGISPYLIKIGLRETSPLMAAFVTYAASSVLMGIWLIPPRNAEKLIRMNRSSLWPVMIAAITMAVAHLLRYTALNYSTISLAQPLFNTNNLFVFPLSFLINREIEHFSIRIFVGAAGIMLGVCLIFWLG